MFFGCSNLTSINIPASVVEIGRGVFCGCSGLTSLHIPASVVKIGQRAFCGCPDVVTVHPDNPVFTSENGKPKRNEALNIQVTIHTSPKIRVEQALKEAGVDDPAAVVKLTVAGRFLKKDFDYICNNMSETLRKLDMNNALPEKNTIPHNAFGLFENESLTSLILPHSLKEIAGQAFCGCESLTSIFIPASVISINTQPFIGCPRLISIEVHPDNPKYASADGALFSKDMSVLICCPDGITGDYAIPGTVREINSSAISNGLTSLTIPASVIKIEDLAFDGCKCLTSITVHPDNPVFESEDGILYQKKGKNKRQTICNPVGRRVAYNSSKTAVKIHACCDNIAISGTLFHLGFDSTFMALSPKTHIPASVAEIDVHPDNRKYASICGVLFNKNMDELLYFPRSRKGDYVVPASAVRIGATAFAECRELTSVVIPASVTEIGNGAFCGCVRLVSVVIPESVKKIGDDAFCHCAGLTSVNIPQSVTEIGKSAFMGCPANLNITVHPDNPNYSSDGCTLLDKNRTEILSCTAAALKGDYVVPDTVTVIRESTFSGCEGLVSVTVSDSVVKIEDDAFNGCSSLCKVIISKSVVEIGKEAFSLSYINIYEEYVDCGESFVEISVHPANPEFADHHGVLFNKDKTVLIRYPEGRQGDYAIPASVTEIGEYAFYGCRRLTSVTIPASVVKIGNNAFRRCDALSTVEIPASVTKISEAMFYGCKNLKSVTIPDSIVEIGMDAFGECLALKSVTIPASVVEIGAYVFDDCPAIITVHPDNPVYAGMNGKWGEK
jgi:hypothetical protein